MVPDFKPSVFKNIPSKNSHHTETSLRNRPSNQKPTETLEIDKRGSSKTTCE